MHMFVIYVDCSQTLSPYRPYDLHSSHTILSYSYLFYSVLCPTKIKQNPLYVIGLGAICGSLVGSAECEQVNPGVPLSQNSSLANSSEVKSRIL